MRPANLVVVLSDEHEARVSGHAGHPLAHTPNLDRLAARGTRFTRAWTPSPICVPARASLATGRWTHETGYWDNAHGYDGRVLGWGHRLIEAGHRVAAVGKLHYRNAADPTGFSEQHNTLHLAEGIGQVWGSVRDPMPSLGPPSPLFRELGAGESSYNRFDLACTRLAVEWLRARASTPDAKPWVLFVGYVAPHFPLVVPQRYLDRYPPDRIPLPKLLPRDGHARHPWVEAQAKHGGHDDTLGTDERRRLALSAYLGLVTFMDEQVGQIVDAIDATGLGDTTRIVYSSDHGDNMGARGMWNKCVLYRESTGVPMIVAGPDVPAGATCTATANLVDLHQTALEGAGLGLSRGDEALPGRSLVALARGEAGADRIGFSEYHAVGSPSGAYMITKGQWKYHYYVGYRPELFDLDADPEEARDLAGDPAHRSIVREMEGELRRLLDPEAVDRRAKDDQNRLVERVGGRERALSLGPKGATPIPG